MDWFKIGKIILVGIILENGKQVKFFWNLLGFVIDVNCMS